MERKQTLLSRIANREAQVGIVGLGYVGLPLAVAFAREGFHVLGVDVDPRKVASLQRGESYVEDVPSAVLGPLVAAGLFSASTDYATLAAAAAIRLGSLDLAVGNLLGSSVFNMFGLALADFFLTDGPFLNLIDPSFALVGLLVILLTNLGLVANLARSERRILFIEVDAVVILIVYVLGLYLLYQRGIGL